MIILCQLPLIIARYNNAGKIINVMGAEVTRFPEGFYRVHPSGYILP